MPIRLLVQSGISLVTLCPERLALHTRVAPELARRGVIILARTWLSIAVELVSGAHVHDLWPRPGRLFIARRSHTFRQLADAINTAFSRWDLAHLHVFTLRDGTHVVPIRRWDDPAGDELDDEATRLSRLELGEEFAYVFDLGDEWAHLCSVGTERVDPVDVYGVEPIDPVPYWGWGWIPDQYGRRFDGDMGDETPVPLPPDPIFSDLPALHAGWGRRETSPHWRGIRGMIENET